MPQLLTFQALAGLGPELGIAGLACLTFILSILLPKSYGKCIFGVALAGIAIIAAVVGEQFKTGYELSLNGMYYMDKWAFYFKLVFLGATFLVILISRDYVAKLRGYRGEFYSLILTALLGMFIIAGAGELITLYIGLELMTITFYILAAYLSDDLRSGEAGIKYLLMGAFSSAILLYGLSLLYGLTGTTQISQISTVFQTGTAGATIVAVFFILAGLAFKVALIPFHMWAPDVYEGAPLPVTAFLAAASKAAGVAVFFRVFIDGFNYLTFAPWLLLVLAGLVTLSMIAGNLMAILQSNFKRLMAYSSIAQAGYLTAGLIAGNEAGVKGALFYAMVYVFANLGAFGAAVLVGDDNIRALAGLSRRAPLAAAVMTISLLSLAGVPPLAGFVGKFYLFSALFAQGWEWLALIGFIMSMVSVYYYLLIVKTMYTETGEDLPPINIKWPVRVTLLFTMLVTLFLGIYPQPLSQMAIAAARSIF